MIIEKLHQTIQAKIVFYGPALSGKTTSIKSLFKYFEKEDEVNSIESTVGRTLFFDYGTLKFKNKKWKLKLHIYTTTGQDFYIVTRPTTLRGVDGLIFVADSQANTYERNIISWNELALHFDDALIELPKIIVFNKQDLPNKFESSKFLKEIEFKKYKNIETESSIAIKGEGIKEAFEKIITLIFKDKTEPFSLISSE